MKNKNKILKEMRSLEKRMDSLSEGTGAYKSISLRYIALAKEIGVALPDPEFIQTIKPCSCRCVEISINTEKGKCYFKCTNCGISTQKCDNREAARDLWNFMVKLT